MPLLSLVSVPNLINTHGISSWLASNAVGVFCLLISSTSLWTPPVSRSIRSSSSSNRVFTSSLKDIIKTFVFLRVLRGEKLLQPLLQIFTKQPHRQVHRIRQKAICHPSSVSCQHPFIFVHPRPRGRPSQPATQIRCEILLIHQHRGLVAQAVRMKR